ncbi:MAG: hypothetical protein LBV06_08415 [Propionibacteriaceae bacterium]|nr:hypothetical protein [Propionibacteriaceae bacterium]
MSTPVPPGAPEIAPQTPVAKPKKKGTLLKIIGAIVAVIILIGIIKSCSGGSSTPATTSTTAAASTTDSTAAQATTEATTEAPKPARDNSTAALTTLGAGTFVVGTDIPAGRYVITPAGGDSGNLFIHSPKQPLYVNEILGQALGLGVPSVTVDLLADMEVEIKRISEVTFTPAETVSATTLTTGRWVVGIDIPAGRYTAAPADPADAGNFFVHEKSGLPAVNEILGGDHGVPNVAVNLKDGQTVHISGITTVNFTQ